MGRNARSPVDVLRTLVWLANIKVVSGFKDVRDIGAAVMADGKRPRTWVDYENGRTAAIGGGEPSPFVARAEVRWPGTAWRFLSPMWTILEGRPISSLDIDKGLLALGPQARRLFFEVRDGRLYRRVFRPSHASALWELRGFEGLVAAVLLMAEAELAHSPELREIGVEAYEVLQGHLFELPDLAEVYPYLFTCIDTMLPRWVCCGLNRRVEVRMRWQDRWWAIQNPVNQLRFPWLLDELDRGVQPNADHIRVVRKMLWNRTEIRLQI
ncbi:MAG: hypothetical protein ACM3VZ_10165 [Acidobacteriota bacterium]